MKLFVSVFFSFLFVFRAVFSETGDFKKTEQPPKIYVFIYVCTLANWREILTEQLVRLKTSGLYDRCDLLLIGLLCHGDIKPFMQKFPKLKIAFQDRNVKLYERPTLLCLHELCLNEPDSLVCTYTQRALLRIDPRMFLTGSILWNILQSIDGKSVFLR